MAESILSGANTQVSGETIAQWTEDWWTWALQAPALTNPLNDPTGGFASVDNPGAGTGPVFFIGGTFSTPTAERTFDVPAGKDLLVPMLNQFDTLDEKDVANSTLSDFQGGVTSLFAEIDGVSVKNPQSDLVRTSFFSMGPTQDGSLAASLGAPVGQELTPSKSAGYWLMVQGLSPGEHTLHFGGSLHNGFSTEVTDHITVLPQS